MRPAVEVLRDRRGGHVEEGVDRDCVGRVAGRDLGGDRIAERQLDRARAHVGGGDGAGVAGAAGLGEMGDDVGLAERAHRLQRHQFGVAGPDADADQPRRAVHDRSSRASALTAAAVTALPPSRPRTVTKGAGACVDQRVLQFGGADEADRNADDRRRTRRAVAQHLEQTEERGRRIADGDDRARQAVDPEVEGGGRAGGAEPRRRDRRRAGRGGCRSRRCRPGAGRG